MVATGSRSTARSTITTRYGASWVWSAMHCALGPIRRFCSSPGNDGERRRSRVWWGSGLSRCSIRSSGGCGWRAIASARSRSFTTKATGALVFASSLEALVQHPQVPRELDPECLVEYVTLRYVVSPRTVLREVKKLGPGQLLEVGPEGSEVRTWWTPRVAERPGLKARSPHGAGGGVRRTFHAKRASAALSATSRGPSPKRWDRQSEYPKRTDLPWSLNLGLHFSVAEHRGRARGSGRAVAGVGPRHGYRGVACRARRADGPGLRIADRAGRATARCSQPGC